jgi:hypothetical protein
MKGMVERETGKSKVILLDAGKARDAHPWPFLDTLHPLR